MFEYLQARSDINDLTGQINDRFKSVSDRLNRMAERVLALEKAELERDPNFRSLEGHEDEQ